MCIFGSDTVLTSSEYHSSGLNFPVVFFESYNDTTHDGLQENTTPLLSSTLRPSFIIHLSSKSLPFVPLCTLLSNKPSQDANTDGAAAACCPTGSPTVGSLPTPSYPVSTGVQKCFGVQTECRGTGGRANLDALLHSDCLAPRTTQMSKIPHICHHTRLTTNSNQSTIVG